MKDRHYWLILFSGVTWQEFVDAGGHVMGFKPHRRKSVGKLEVGDYLLCYVTGISRFIGVLEVTSLPFIDNARIFKDDLFPHRVKVSSVLTLSFETALPVLELKDKLAIFKTVAFPNKYGAFFQSSLAKWNTEDGELIVQALQKEVEHPTIRHYLPDKLVMPTKRVV